MRTILFASLLLVAVDAGFSGNTAAWYRRGTVQYEKRLKLTIQNPLAEARTEEPVVLRLDEIQKQAPDFSAGSFTLVDPAATPESPCHIEEGGNDVPCEAQDIDGDGTTDELIFLATLPAKESKTYFLYYTVKNGPPAPVYPKRTQITDFKGDPNALLAIESDTLMLRFGRGDGVPLGLVGDLFGKYKERPAYLQHLFHGVILEMNRDTPAGRWLLYPLNKPDQLGLGSLAAVKGGQVFRPDASAKLSGKVLANGRLCSRGEITVADWKVGDAILDVRIVVTMYAGQPYADYELEAKAKGPAADLRLGVGMMKLEDQQVFGGLEQGFAAAWGVHNAEFTGQSACSWFGYGYQEAEKWTAKSHGTLAMGMALMFRPEDAAELKQEKDGSLLVLKGTPAEAQPLKTRLALSGGWKRGGYFDGDQDFLKYHQALGQRLRTPLRVVVGLQETRVPQRDRIAFKNTTFFISNPSSQDTVLPAEIDLDAFGLEAKEGVVCPDKNMSTDTVKVGGQTRVFVQAPVPALRTKSVTLASGKGSASASFKLTETKAESGALKAIKVEAGEATWLVTTNGLARAAWKGKELDLQQPGLTGEVQAVYNGSAVAVVRVGSGESSVDYCFFRGLPAVKVFSGLAIDLQGGKGYSSYVAKKELSIEKCEQLPACRWGRVTSDRCPRSTVVDGRIVDTMKTDVCYPAEWAALYSPEQKAALMAYGDPSTGPMIVDKGGVLHVDAPKAGEQRSMTLCLIERPEEGEDAFPRLCGPIVSIAHEKGFLSQAYRDGNNVPDVVFVEDRNGNKQPDFAGDRWSFDMNSDDALESILEFDPAPGKTDRAATMKVYCDTTTGQTELHSNQFLGRFGEDRPYPDEPRQACFVIANACFYDGCLGPGETKTPFFTYEDWDGDGLFFKGPVTEGGFISGDRVTARYGGPAWWPGCFLLKNWMLECWDLDGDRDNDVWWIKGINPPAGLADIQAGDHYLHWGYFDLSDVNLEPIALVDVSRGRAAWAVRSASFIDSDNGKLYQQGYQTGDQYVGSLDWPFASGWDIDNDGAAEGHFYINICNWWLALDLAKGVDSNDPLIKDRIFLEKDQLYTRPSRHENFCLVLREPRDDKKVWSHEYLQKRFQPATIKDPQGHAMRFHGLGVPDGWKGEARQCKEWPNGEYDYLERNGWSEGLRKTYFVAALHWIGPLWRTAHEGNWGLVWFAPEYRYEANPDGTEKGGAEAYHLYYSPILNAMHLKGIHFGIQVVPALAKDAPQEVKNNHSGIRSKYAAAYPYTPVGYEEGISPEKRNNDYSREARRHALSFLYYTDCDRDGYVDTYLLDDNCDGYYEKLIWHDRKAGVLRIHDRNQQAVIPITLEFPEHTLALKGYKDLVPLNRKSDESKSMLYQVSITNNAVAGLDHEFSMVLSTECLPRVAVDAAHMEKKSDPWSNYEPAGLDTLGRVFSEEGATLETLGEDNFKQSLGGADVLVIREVSKPYREDEVKALQAFLAAGNTVLLLWPGDAGAPGAAGMRSLAAALGVEGADIRPFQAEPKMTDAELDDLLKKAKDSTAKLMERVEKPVFVEGKEMAAGKQVKALLEYAGSVLIAEAPVGKGKVVICASKLLENHFMSLEVPLRLKPYKAGNQQLAANLARYLFGDRAVKVSEAVKNKGWVKLKMASKGGKVFLKVPWADAKVNVNGKLDKAERVGDTLTLTLPPGQVELKVEGVAKGD